MHKDNGFIDEDGECELWSKFRSDALKNKKLEKLSVAPSTNQYRDFCAMCDFDACDFNTFDFNIINPLFANLHLAMLMNREKKAKKEARLNAEKCDNMNMYSTGKPCECKISHHRAYKVMVLDVLQSNETTQKSDDSRCKSPGTSSPLTHQFVDIYFKCEKCRCEFSCVSEFDNNGKHWYWYKVGESRRPLGRECNFSVDPKQSLLGSEILVKSADIDRSYKFVKQKYDSMPNKGYHVENYNSIRWANKFYNRLI